MFKSWFLCLFLSCFKQKADSSALFLSCFKQKVDSSACSFHVLKKKVDSSALFLSCFKQRVDSSALCLSCFKQRVDSFTLSLFMFWTESWFFHPPLGRLMSRKQHSTVATLPVKDILRTLKPWSIQVCCIYQSCWRSSFLFQFCIGNIFLSYFISYFIWTFLCLHLVLEC